MKMLKTLGLGLLLTLVFVACKKNNDSPAFTMEGFWEGKLSEGSSAPKDHFAMKLKAGGIIERYSSSGTVSATGIWQLNGNNFTANYSFTSGTVVTLVGIFDPSKNKITGSWTNNGDNDGLWNASK